VLPCETSPVVQPAPALEGNEDVELPWLDQRADVTPSRLWKSSGNACGKSSRDGGGSAGARATVPCAAIA
jgi:hypothetical protein